MASTRNAAVANKGPVVKFSTLVQGAVDCGLIPNTTAARADYEDWARRDGTAAVRAMAGYGRLRKARAAKRRPVAAAGTLYPASWAPRNGRNHSVVRAGAALPIATPLPGDEPGPSEYPAGWRSRLGSFVPGLRVRGGRTARSTAKSPVAASTVPTARTDHHDRHNLIAAAGGNAARLAAMRRAEITQREQVQAARYAH